MVMTSTPKGAQRDGSGGGTTLFARMIGARDLGLGLGLLIALDRGAPVRGGSKHPPW